MRVEIWALQPHHRATSCWRWAVPDERTRVALARIFKRLRQRQLKKSLKELPEFKATNMPPYFRRVVLQAIAELPVKIYSLIAEKTVLRSTSLQTDEIYEQLTGRLLVHALATGPEREFNLVLDKRLTSPWQRQAFDEYLLELVEGPSPGIEPLRMRMSHLASHTCPQIQAVDFIAWSFFQAHEHGDTTYSDIFSHRTKKEIQLRI